MECAAGGRRPPRLEVEFCSASGCRSGTCVFVISEGASALVNYLSRVKGDRIFILSLQVSPACISAVGLHHKNRHRVHKRYRTIS